MLTEWTVVGVIVVLIGLIAMIASPLAKFVSTLTTLTNLVDNLKEHYIEQEGQVKDLDKQVQNHEFRIHDIEVAHEPNKA